MMLFYDPTKGGITFRIPKWIRFPIMILAVAVVLGVLYTMSYIAQLESQIAIGNSEVQSSEYVIYNKDAEIIELQETDLKRYDQLKALSTLTVKLQGELEGLKEYKAIIDEKLGSTQKTTEAQPSKMSTVTKASDVVSLTSEDSVMESEEEDIMAFKMAVQPELVAQAEIAVMSDEFSAEVDRLLSELSDTLDQINEEETSFEERDEQIDEILPFWDAYPSILPVVNDDTYITSPYGYRRNPFGRGYEFHSGVDFKAYYEEICATGSGTVTYSGYNNGYGYMVIIDHGYGIVTKYAHNSKLYVSEGDQVCRGDVIAKSGNSGRSSGPHLHYEVLLDGENQDPMEYMYNEGDE